MEIVPGSVWMVRSPGGELLWTLRAEALLEMIGAEGLSPEFMVGSLWRVAGEGRGLLYARRAMRIQPATRRVRSAAVVSEEVPSSEGGWGFAYWFSLSGDVCTNVPRERSLAEVEGCEGRGAVPRGLEVLRMLT